MALSYADSGDLEVREIIRRVRGRLWKTPKLAAIATTALAMVAIQPISIERERITVTAPINKETAKVLANNIT